MKVKLIVFATLFLLLTIIRAASALITSYDIQSTRLSGTDGWFYDYSGTITPNPNDMYNETYNYYGGSGTMNDGEIGTSHRNTQLFHTQDRSTITVYLSETVHLTELFLYSFPSLPPGNGIPGNIESFDLTINGTTEKVDTNPFGPNNQNGPAHEYVNLAGTSIVGIATDVFTLSNFIIISDFTHYTDGYFDSYFSISEIAYNGDSFSSTPVPEPATIFLFGTGVAVLSANKRRKNKK